MVDQKITELTELTTPESGDLFAIVDDPAGSPVTKKITRDNVIAEVDTIVTTITSSATPTPARASKYTLYEITAQAENPTIGAPTGTPEKGDRLLFWITDDGTGRTISRNAIYENGTATMASGTTVSTKLTELYIYNGTKWQCVYSEEDV